MKNYQTELDNWFKQNSWQYWEPLAILARLTEETGEVARIVNHLHGPKKKKADEMDQDLEEEMGDIIYTLMCYANSQGLDLDRAIRKSMDKVIKRDGNRFDEDKS
jgi:NTP pyrophosphatase (non-canonical NTP hydrolase)